MISRVIYPDMQKITLVVKIVCYQQSVIFFSGSKRNNDINVVSVGKISKTSNYVILITFHSVG